MDALNVLDTTGHYIHLHESPIGVTCLCVGIGGNCITAYLGEEESRQVEAWLRAKRERDAKP